ncbi:6-phosphogluconolactonase [Microbacterium sp. MEC084]|jgi:6-phosphogluconolactonase|uniref:6-phosphogluconolactonase n=1 Tax=unclassified Microbacterium TaxID=2609290 RepID=UPI0006FB9F1D|nr:MULTISPECIES: 6-phosphogluconolactonase [unclassified Microbacterium]KQZ04870.1 6-phosphogluconolactonase [Microbacterium sp. Root53]MCD1267484.1 6-phosphogluconolactonase [Microbacterium sp. MEC084]
MTERRVVVLPDKAQLAEGVANRFVGKLAQLTQEGRTVHVSLTGGSMGSAVLAATAEHGWASNIDWSLVHFWWSDERFVPRGDAERNAGQARAALLDRIAVPAENIHEPASTDDGVSLDEAAEAYAAELARFGTDERPWPEFDVCFLGVGPDGHIASLFPDRGEVHVADRAVLPVRESPKPPPERITFTRPVINSSVRIWMVVAGADKASALGLMLAGAGYASVPAAGAEGTARTVVFVDQDAAANVPEELIDPDY